MLSVACPVLAQAPSPPAEGESRSATVPTLEDLQRRVEEQEKLIARQREEMGKQQALQEEQDKKLADLQEQLLPIGK